MKPRFAALGLEMNQFVVESVSLPDDLQKVMDQRIGVNMAGDLGRLTQFEAAESLEEAAQNTRRDGGNGRGPGRGRGDGAGHDGADVRRGRRGRPRRTSGRGGGNEVLHGVRQADASRARSSAPSAGSSNELPIVRSADAAWRAATEPALRLLQEHLLPRTDDTGVRYLDEAPELPCPVCAAPLWNAILAACRCVGARVPGHAGGDGRVSGLD